MTSYETLPANKWGRSRRMAGSTWWAVALAVSVVVSGCSTGDDGTVAPTTSTESGQSTAGSTDLATAHATVTYSGTSYDFDDAIACTLSPSEPVPLRATFADDEQFFGNPDAAAVGLAIGTSGDDTRIQLKLNGFRWNGLPGSPTIDGGTATWAAAELTEVDGLADPITATIEVTCG
jgi:hypothetical protein